MDMKVIVKCVLGHDRDKKDKADGDNIDGSNKINCYKIDNIDVVDGLSMNNSD